MRTGACAAGIATVVLWMHLFLCGRYVGAVGGMSEEPLEAGSKNDTPPDVPDFWPEVAGDLRKVTWAHAVNSRKDLDKALKSEVMMLEADVSLAQDGYTPIMAHPPANSSDLTLEQFLEDVISSTKKKGAKLDFKSLEAWVGAAPLLEALQERLGGVPLWLNADVVRGPGGGAPGVDARRFLADCVEKFPGRALSAGWTTGAAGRAYTDVHVRNMQETLSAANVSTAQPLTFPVRAAQAAQSSTELMTLLRAWPKATLTFWGAEDDKVDNEKLLALAKEAGFARVYVDLPNEVPGLTGDAPLLTCASAMLYMAALALALMASRLY